MSQLHSVYTFGPLSPSIIRDDTAEPTTNVAENHNDVPQAASLLIRGAPRGHSFNCARAGTFLPAFDSETTPRQIKLQQVAKAIPRRSMWPQSRPCVDLTQGAALSRRLEVGVTSASRGKGPGHMVPACKCFLESMFIDQATLNGTRPN